MKRIIPLAILLLLTLTACAQQPVVVNVIVTQEVEEDAPVGDVVAPTPTEVEAAPVSAEVDEVPPPTEVEAAPTPVPAMNTSTVDLCKLPSRVTNDPYQYQLLGIPRHTGFAPSTGVVEVAVLFVDYSDVRATTSPEQELGRLSPFALSQYFSDISYGRMELDIKPHATWLNLSQPVSYYTDLILEPDRSEEVERDLIQEAVDLADPDVDFSNTDIIIVFGNPQASEDYRGPYIFSTTEDSLGIQVDGTSIRTGLMVGSSVLRPDSEDYYRNHGFSRSIMLAMSLQALRFGSDYSEDANERASSVGSFSNMGNWSDLVLAPGLFAFERWQLGWLDDGQIVCQTGGEQTTDLSAIEQAGGTKAVIIPIDERSALVVESRRAIGTDQKLIKEGALVYTVDTSTEPNGAPIRVLPMLDNDLYRNQSPLAQGESITHCNITITNVAKGAEGDTVLVNIPGAISCAEETASQDTTPSQGQEATAEPTMAAEPTNTPESTETPDLCAAIPNPDAGFVRIHIPNYTNEQIWATEIRWDGSIVDESTYSAMPGEYIWYTMSPGLLVAIMDSNMDIIRIFVSDEGPTQCEEATSTTPDETAEIVLITFTNGTNEGLFICRENEPLDYCGFFNPGDVTSPHAMYPTGAYYFIGDGSGTNLTYVATDSPNQTVTITK